MKLVATKLEMETVGKMSKLVIENIDAISSDLTVLDARLLLGNANIDVVALDGTGSLVLIAIDRASDEQLMLKAVEAYSWCLEYPEAVRRLYPASDVSVARPPRVMFVVERMSDSFHRKVKQLGFPQVDCVEFRHLAIDGAEAVHFDTIVRLRRAALVSEDRRPAAPVSASTPARGHAELDASAGARATSVKPQTRLTSDTPAPNAVREAGLPAEHPAVERPAAPTAVSAPATAREPGVVVNMTHRPGRHAAPARLDDPPITSAAHAGLAPAVKHPVMSAVTPRPVRDAQPTAEPVSTITMEPAAIVAPILELAVEPQPVAAPEPLAVAPLLVPEPIVPPAPVIVPVIESQPTVAPEAIAGAPDTVLIVEPVPIDAPEPVAASATVLELGAEPKPTTAPEPVVAVAPVPEMVVKPTPPSVAPAPAIAVAPAIELMTEPMTEPAPTATAPEPPRISFADLSRELLASQAVDRKSVVAAKPVATTRPAEPPAAIKPARVASSENRINLADLSKVRLSAPAPVRTPQANGPTPMRLEISPVAEPPKVAAMGETVPEQMDSAEAPVAPALPSAAVIDVAPVPMLTVASLVGAAAPAAPPAAPEAPQDPASAGLPQEFEGLKFPGDGVLTRQWMDFLNQMTATK